MRSGCKPGVANEGSEITVTSAELGPAHQEEIRDQGESPAAHSCSAMIAVSDGPTARCPRKTAPGADYAASVPVTVERACVCALISTLMLAGLVCALVGAPVSMPWLVSGAVSVPW
ncbi:hypothetical protein AAFF_G00013620 [Aldrovandia affinis]|uniref:Uncharacterized protein n=1 Tax=Aldrovandia affinis TaxID=143900 RepID=A0AAD7WHA1_9TELE|nr:hypothetical protein AAFF_G00013620 [Aldrovandia affinis]